MLFRSRYSEIAKKIRSGTFKNIDDIKKRLLDIYPDDKTFTDSFKNKDIQDNSIAKYILNKIDIAIGNYSESIDYSSLSLEHILPKSPKEQWSKYLKKQGLGSKEVKELIHKLGNLTLLDVTINRQAANNFYTFKRDQYFKASKLKINEHLKKITQWNKSSILSRQARLAETAKKVWKI